MKVVICTPIRNGMVHHRFTASLVDTTIAIRQVEIKWSTVVGNSILPDARANCVAAALGEGADKIVFIDDDMSWKPDDFRFLITHPVDACTGLYVIRNTDDNVPCTSAVRFFPDTPHETDENGLVSVEAAGFGFICFDRSVFERLAPHCPLMLADHLPAAARPYFRDWFPYGMAEKDGLYHRIGEDMGFGRLMTKHGMKTMLDPAIQLGHHEGAREYRPTVDLYGGIRELARNQKAA